MQIVKRMWEEHPEYQKAQARMIGLLVLAVFIGSALYGVAKHNWEILRLVLYAGVGLILAVAVLSLGGRLVVKALSRIFGKQTKPPPTHDA